MSFAGVAENDGKTKKATSMQKCLFFCAREIPYHGLPPSQIFGPRLGLPDFGTSVDGPRSTVEMGTVSFLFFFALFCSLLLFFALGVTKKNTNNRKRAKKSDKKNAKD